MAKAKFQFLANSEVIEIPTSLKIINNLLSSLDDNDFSDEDSISETYEEGTHFFNEEITKIFCEKNGLDHNIHHAEIIPVSKEDSLLGIELSVRIIY